MSNWDLTENDDFSVAGKGTTVAAPPPAPVDTATSSSGNDSSTSSSSSDSASTNEVPQRMRELQSVSSVQGEIDALVRQGYTLQQVQQKFPDVPVDAVGQAYEAAAYTNNPMNVTPGQTPEEISAQIEAQKAKDMQAISGAVFGMAGIATGAALLSDGVPGSLSEGFGTGVSEKMIFEKPLIDVAALTGQKDNQVEGTSVLSASSSPELANNGLGLASGIMGGNTMLSGNAQNILADIGEFKLDTAQFSSLSPSVMAAVGREGSNLLNRVEGVRDLDSVSATVDDSVRANAGVGASVGQNQSAAVATR